MEAVSIVLTTLNALLSEKDKFLKGVVKDVKELENQLREMKYLLKDAGRKQHQCESVRGWIMDTRDLAYAAEDAIAVYAAESFSHWWRRYAGIYPLHHLQSQISCIKSSIAGLRKSMLDYGIKSILDGAQSSDLYWARRTFPDFLVEDCFVGKEDELRTLVALLVGDDNRRVISVWGMGGIGKTTIAKNAYNHRTVTSFFESFAWVCVTQQCNIRSVLEDVLKQLAPENVGGVSSLGDMQLNQQLCQIQSAKRCLIVLDDIWET